MINWRLLQPRNRCGRGLDRKYACIAASPFTSEPTPVEPVFFQQPLPHRDNHRRILKTPLKNQNRDQPPPKMPPPQLPHRHPNHQTEPLNLIPNRRHPRNPFPLHQKLPRQNQLQNLNQIPQRNRPPRRPALAPKTHLSHLSPKPTVTRSRPASAPLWTTSSPAL